MTPGQRALIALLAVACVALLERRWLMRAFEDGTLQGCCVLDDYHGRWN